MPVLPHEGKKCWQCNYYCHKDGACNQPGQHSKRTFWNKQACKAFGVPCGCPICTKIREERKADMEVKVEKEEVITTDEA